MRNHYKPWFRDSPPPFTDATYWWRQERLTWIRQDRLERMKQELELAYYRRTVVANTRITK